MKRRAFTKLLGFWAFGAAAFDTANLFARTRKPASLITIGEDDAAYGECLSHLHNGAAAASQPALIVQPRTEDEVRSAIRLANQSGLKISVCSGSHSRYCAQDKTLMLDYSKFFNRIDVRGDTVQVQAGASMGQLLKTLAPFGRMVPVGTYPTPGFGLLTMGGVGHLSRSLGLTLDAIEEIRGFRADGEPFLLKVSGEDKEGWVLARGAAVFFAIVTEARLKTYPRASLMVQRAYSQPESFADLLDHAENLTRDAACSFILGKPPGQDSWQALSYAVAPVGSQDPGKSISHLPKRWETTAEGLELLPPFELPTMDGHIPPPSPPSSDRHKRARTWVYSISIPRGRRAALAKVLSVAMDALPNPDCRIDLQHVGGAVAETAPYTTAYTGRAAEWSVVVTAVWLPQDVDMEQRARNWATSTFQSLRPLANHYYIVQRHPDTSTYRDELDLAYGPLLPALRERKMSWDPKNLLPSL